MIKLLNQPLRAFALYALLILAISVPTYVFLINHIWTSELDENNWNTLQHTKQKLLSNTYSATDIENISHMWGELQPGVSIERSDGDVVLKDQVYEIMKPNLFDAEDGEIRFRGLKSGVELNGQLYVLTIETNVEESDETFAAVALVTLLFFVILIVGFILLNRRIATKTWHPFYQTLQSLKSFELSKDRALELPTTNIQEFHEMNQSLLQLVKNNVDAYQQQKSFTENASHELQTPIALLKSKMDLLIQQKSISPEISEILNSIQGPLARLSRINKNLLVLAKVENHQYSDAEPLDVKEYIENTIYLFEDYIEEKHIEQVNRITSPLVIHANSFLVETLIHNLLSNAIRHTEMSGKIEISNNEKSIQVSNTGNQSLDPSQLFQRFTNTTKNKVSSGLGLAIIQEIANKYSWQVSYHFKKGFHVFSVNFL